jgi:hypothetical protein
VLSNTILASVNSFVQKMQGKAILEITRCKKTVHFYSIAREVVVNIIGGTYTSNKMSGITRQVTA